MQLNLYGILSVALAISSIFLPLISSSLTVVCMQDMVIHSMDITFLKWSGSSSYCLVNDTSFSVHHHVEWIRWPRMQSTYSLSGLLYVSLVPFFLFYVYSICLAIHGTFTNGSWSKAGRRTFMIASFLSLSSILLYLISLIVNLHAHYGLNPFRNGSFITVRTWFWQVKTSLTYFNIGLYTALLSTILTFLAWLRPKFVNLPTGIRIRGYSKLKDSLNIPEKEKLLTIFLSSFLIVLLFTIFYFLLPTIKI